MLLTVGHGTASQDELAARLLAAEVEAIVDIRIAPGSKRHPHVSRDALADWLPAAGISYRWEKRLGGFRRPTADSPDVALRNDAFRGYAAHMRTADFREAVDGVLADAAAGRVAVMCSETVWWRCHRRLVSDFVKLACEVDVFHVMPAGAGARLEPHRATDGVRLQPEGLLVYDAGVQPLPSSD